MVDGLLTLEFETKGGSHKVSLRQKDDKLIGGLIAAQRFIAGIMFIS